ncbi:hypothetical protein NU08_2567 [Flavobacterium anhuiense]|uniref:Uncharacterized protein n=1 Tax=Flavobacterium anhuiense TaxID=459526 RepID=A0A444VY89_9FLAO|nr:hypothetical protein NU08_2567 [Flavobacterium anhuiense]
MLKNQWIGINKNNFQKMVLFYNFGFIIKQKNSSITTKSCFLNVIF